MTLNEFKEKYPQYNSVEGEQLWNLMEDILLQERNNANTDIILSEEDEKQYQIACKANSEANTTVVNYTRAWWYAFDKVHTNIKPNSFHYIIFGISDESTKVLDVYGNEYENIDELMKAKEK